jgi:hypothetical protein
VSVPGISPVSEKLILAWRGMQCIHMHTHMWQGLDEIYFWILSHRKCTAVTKIESFQSFSGLIFSSSTRVEDQTLMYLQYVITIVL